MTKQSLEKTGRGDARREWCLWVLFAADAAGIEPGEALDLFEATYVDEVRSPDPSLISEWFRIERLEDYLPSPEEWCEQAEAVRRTAEAVGRHRDEIDAIVRAASPRWRVDRMPAIDRSLIRLGVAELRFLGPPRPKQTINGLIELAKRYGEEATPKFVNGILDQVRRNLEIPYA